jgi:hypothetical protein
MLKGVSSMSAHCGCALLCSIQPLPLLTLTPLRHTLHFSTAFNTHPYILYLHILCYVILLMLYRSLFHSLCPWVTYSSSTVTNMSTSEFVHDHACFCVYVYVWICLPCMRENMQPLCFWAWLTSLTMISSNCTHLPSNLMSLFLWLSNTPLCIYTFCNVLRLQVHWAKVYLAVFSTSRCIVTKNPVSSRILTEKSWVSSSCQIHDGRDRFSKLLIFTWIMSSVVGSKN